MSNPAPIDSVVVTEDWELSIHEVGKGEDAWKLVEDANQFNDPPTEGMQYIAVKVGVHYIGTEENSVNISDGYFKTTGSTGVLHDNPFAVEPDPDLDVYLFPGGKYVGWIILQAGVDESDIVLVFEPRFDSSHENRRFISLD